MSVLHPRFVCEGLGNPRVDERLGEDYGDAVLLHEIGELGDALRIGFRVGRESGDTFLAEPVTSWRYPNASCEVTMNPCAVRQADCVALVECVQLAEERPRVSANAAVPLGSAFVSAPCTWRTMSSIRRGRATHGDRARRVAFLDLLVAGVDGKAVEERDGGTATSLRGLLDRRLEAVSHHEDDPGIEELVGLRGQ